MGTNSTPRRRDHADLSSDELFHVLANANRRTVLFHLRQHRAATVDELTDVITEISGDESQVPNREQLRASLHHSQFPTLVNAGLITYDPEQQIAESTDVHGQIGEWLDLAVRHQLQLESVRETQQLDGRTEIHVLLVDDEPGLPEAIGAYIERENDDMTVTTATSPLEAVTRLEEAPFDCIVSDYQMPAISGLDFLKAVREEDATVPFIVFTAKGSETVASQAIETGVTDYVQKGPDTERYDELAARIRKAVADD
ncbi:response regulator [Haloarchaeobius amylolyticus]|uniref:Response regulator n=1 Tax=Haloarchaeobius amylolyticus TaxID=1198296 RepID=A0ABD6BHW5_9EURY